MTKDDKRIIIDWLSDTSPKGIMEDTNIKASSKEVQGFINEVREALIEHYCSPAPVRRLGPGVSATTADMKVLYGPKVKGS